MIMSMTTTAGVHDHADGGALAKVAAALKRLGAAYLGWRMEQAAIAALQAMTDPELRDIGLARSDIPSAVRGRAPRDRTVACEL